MLEELSSKDKVVGLKPQPPSPAVKTVFPE